MYVRLFKDRLVQDALEEFEMVLSSSLSNCEMTLLSFELSFKV